jgi:hypothetical protein
MNTKICYACKQELPVKNFHRRTLNGVLCYQPYCKPCDNKRKAAWKRAHSEKVKEDNRKYYQKPETKERLSERRIRLHQEAIIVLGGKCAHCGFSDMRALQIDHVNGGGHQERKHVNQETICKRILQGKTEGYQVLCANCNWIKRIEQKEHFKVTPKITAD